MDASLFLIRRTEADADRITRQQLEALDLAAASLLQQSQPAKALDLMEQSLHHRQSLYGTAEAVSYCRSIAKKVVIAAVQQLEKSDITQPLGLLHRVERMMLQFPAVKLVCESCDVFNNIACAYRKQGRLALAKQYILKALKLAAVYREAPVDRAATHLNMCAILSSMGQHSAALDYGLKAVQYAQEDLVNASLKGKNDAPHRVTVLAVAYHNAGVEEEHLSHKEAALSWYEKALKFIETHGTEKHKQVRKEFKRTYKAALKALANSRAKGGTEGRVKPVLPLKRRPVSAYKHERRYRPLASPSRRESEEDSQTSVQPMLQTVSQTHFRSSFPVRKQSSDPPESDFYLRDPLEGKPQTFEAIRKQRTQSRASATAERDRGSGRRKRPEGRVESDEDLKELEAMGLLDYSLEPTRRDPAKAGVRRIRGKRKLARSPGRPTVPPNKDEASESRTETSPFTPNSGSRGGNKDFPRSVPRPVAEHSAERAKEREQAAVRIQAAYRGLATRRTIRKAKPTAWKLVGRSGKLLSTGEIAAISLYRASAGRCKVTASISDTRELDLIVTLAEEIDWKDVISRVELWNNALILLPAAAEKAKTALLIRIQAFLRGAIARRRFRLLKAAKAKGKSVVLRTVRVLEGRYVQFSLLKDTQSSLLYVSADHTEAAIPSELALQPLPTILSQVTIKAGKLTFAAFSTSPGPNSPEKRSTEVDEATVTRLQSIIRMRKQQSQYHSLQAKQSKVKERLAQRELQLQDAAYLVTLTRLKAEKIEIEVEAYPLLSVDFMPKKTKYDEEKVKKAYGWSGDVALYAQELLAEVRLEGAAAVLRKLTAAFQQLFYQTYQRFEGILYEITFKETDQMVEISLKPDSGGEITALLTCSEASLRHLAGVEGFWLPRHFESLVSRLSLSSHSLTLSESIQSSKSDITIAVQETREANAISTDAYTRIASKSGQIAKSAEAAAVLIQSQIRRFLAKKELRSYGSKRKAAYRTFRIWPDGRSFAVEMYEKEGLGVEIRAVEVRSREEYRGEIESKGRNGLNFEEISEKLWTSGSSIHFFHPDNMLMKHHRAATTIAKVIRGTLARKLYKSLAFLSEKQFQLYEKRTFGEESLGVAVYSLHRYVQIEVFPLKKANKGKLKAKWVLFAQKDLISFHSGQGYYQELVKNVAFIQGKVSLQAQIATGQAEKGVLVTSLRLQTHTWTVTMSLNHSETQEIVQFAAYRPNQTAIYRTETTIKDLARLSGLAQGSVYAQGSVIIHQLLRFEGETLSIAEGTAVPALDFYATAIQAHVRGFLARRKLISAAFSTNSLLISGVVQLEGEVWTLLAYRERPYIRLEAVNSKAKAVLSTLISEKVIKRPGSLGLKLLLARLVFPRVYLVGRRHIRLSRAVSTELVELHQGQIQVVRKEKQAEMALQVAIFPREAQKEAKSSPINTDLAGPIPAHPNLPSPASPQSSPEVLPESPPSPSHSDHTLLLRSGLELQSRYLVASIYHRTSHSILVELKDPDSHEKASKEISLSDCELRELDQYCNDLLTRVKLVERREGRLDFEVGLATWAVLEVLYKKSHYVSDRYCVVTVVDTQVGVVVTAFDPQAGKTLELRLGRCGGLSAEQLQREIAVLVKRLRIQEVLGEETLVLASS